MRNLMDSWSAIGQCIYYAAKGRELGGALDRFEEALGSLVQNILPGTKNDAGADLVQCWETLMALREE